MRKSIVIAALAGAIGMAAPARAVDQQAYLSKFLAAHPANLQAWNRMIAAAPAPRWLKRYLDLHGSESPAQTIVVGDEAYQVFTSCKPHDCFTEFAAVFSDDASLAWGAIADYGAEARFYGAPDPNVAEALRRALDRR
jgi:hypothetical protein